MTHLRLAIPFALLAACGGSSSSSSTSIDSLPQSFAHAYCTKAFQCCSTADLAVKFQGLNITDEASCETTYGSLLQLVVNQVKVDITAGNVTYSGDDAGDCLSTLDSLSCAQFASSNIDLSNGQTCADPFMGKIADGGSCADDESCASAHCSGAGSGTNGMCAELPTEGQACPDFDCASGSYCDSSTGTPMCAALLADGATCDSADQCKSGGCNGAQGAMTCGASTVCDGM